MKLFGAKAAVALAAGMLVCAGAQAKYLGNVTLAGTAYFKQNSQPSFNQVQNYDWGTAWNTCRNRFPTTRSIKMVSTWVFRYYASTQSAPVPGWEMKSNWNCFDSTNAT